MSLLATIETLLPAFEKEQVRYALIGGFALQAYGIIRATVDIDWLILDDDRNTVRDIVEAAGWVIAFDSENAFTASPKDEASGTRIDILWARRKISRQMLADARSLVVPGLGREIRVVTPTDLAGLKIQAYCNQPEREFHELADIAELSKLPASQVNLKLLKSYFELFDKEEHFKNLFPNYES